MPFCDVFAAASDACFSCWPMESMSSKARSPRNEPVSGRRYILEVSVKNDCRWRRGWNWNWRIRNGEKIPTGGTRTRTATSHTSLYIHEKMCRGCYRETDSMAYLSIQEDREGHVDTHTSYIHTPRRFFLIPHLHFIVCYIFLLEFI